MSTSHSQTSASAIEKWALLAAIASPVLYFESVIAAGLATPGFSFTRQFASEIGMAGMPHAGAFNAGVMLGGVCALVGAFGFALALRRVSQSGVGARWAPVTVASLGVALVVAAMFPLPDIRHVIGSSLGFPLLAGPVLLAHALRRNAQARRLRVYLLITDVLLLAALVGFFSSSGGNFKGLSQFLYTLVAIPWIGVSAISLLRFRAEGSDLCAGLKTTHARQVVPGVGA
jgi:hypothetical membrane protein